MLTWFLSVSVIRPSYLYFRENKKLSMFFLFVICNYITNVIIILLITLFSTVSYHYYIIVNSVGYFIITLLSFLEIGKMS